MTLLHQAVFGPWLRRAGFSSTPIARRSRDPRGQSGSPETRFRFSASESGVAALEFAIVAPMVITLLLGGFEVSRYVKQVRQITNVANSIAQMISQNTNGFVNDTDLHFFIDSAMLTFPDLLPASAARSTYWWQNIDVSMNSINFTPTVVGCTSNCTYTAKVVWTSAAYYPRPCSTLLTAAPDAAQPSQTTLPSDSYGPGSIIAVDVNYTYRPSIGGQFIGSIPIKRSFFVQPRYVSLVKYQPDYGGMATQCSSY